MSERIQGSVASAAATTPPDGATASASQPLLAPSLALLLVTLAGRFSLDRLGVDALGWLDLRVVGVAACVVLVLFEARTLGPAQTPRRREGWLVTAMLFFLFQVGSGLWAPATARVEEVALDIAVMAALTMTFYLHARRDPLVVARRMIWFLYLAAVLFGVVALFVTGPGVQGRYSAFGGGPNVFVRIEVLGVICAVGLAALGVRRWVLLAVPLLLVAAVLSGSRGGLFALVVVGLACAVVARGRSRGLVLAGFAGAGVVVAVASALSLGSGLIQTRFVEQTFEQGYSSARVGIWADTLGLAADSPIIGAGLDGYYGFVGSRVGLEYPHNYVLAVIGEGGAIGLALFVAAVVLWVRAVKTAGPTFVEGRTLLASAAYVATASAFSGDNYDARLAWICAALAALVYTLPRTAPAEQDAPTRVTVHSNG